MMLIQSESNIMATFLAAESQKLAFPTLASDWIKPIQSSRTVHKLQLKTMKRSDNYAGNQVRLFLGELKIGNHASKLKALQKFQSYIEQNKPEVLC